MEIAEGSNVRLDSDEWAEIILYNGARGVPVTTFISGGTTNKVQSPWIFNPEATDPSRRWQLHDNQNNYAHLISDEIERGETNARQ